MAQLFCQQQGQSFRILNLGHCDLFEIWYLVLGILIFKLAQTHARENPNVICSEVLSSPNPVLYLPDCHSDGNYC